MMRTSFMVTDGDDEENMLTAPNMAAATSCAG